MARKGVITLQYTLWTECNRKANKQMKSKILFFPFWSLWFGLGRYVHIVSPLKGLPASLASSSLYSLPQIYRAVFYLISLPKITPILPLSSRWLSPNSSTLRIHTIWFQLHKSLLQSHSQHLIMMLAPAFVPTLSHHLPFLCLAIVCLKLKFSFIKLVRTS